MIINFHRMFDVTDGEECNESYNGFVNHNEATFVTKLVEALLTLADLNKQSIGIITFYDKHCLLLRNNIKEKWPKYYNRIEIATVEEFHGTEKDIVIISCVNSIGKTNEKNLASIAENLVIALTRAKQSLFICGQLRCLLLNEVLKDIIMDAEERQVIYRVSSFLSPSMIEMLVSKI